MKWFIGVLVLLLAALVLESGLLAYAMYVLLGLLLATRILARSWTANLEAERICDRDTAEVGEGIPVTVVVQNKGRLPVPWVLIEDLLPRWAFQPTKRLRVKGKRLQIATLW